jgi:hypothetical protein
MTEAPRRPRKPRDNDRVNTGGLFRCCLDTLAGLYLDGPARIAKEGQTLQCKYAPDSPNHRMIFRKGCWEWDRKAAGLEEEASNAGAK